MNIRNLLLGFLSCCLFFGLSAQNGFHFDELHEWSKGTQSEVALGLEVNQKLKMDEKLYSSDKSHYLVVQDDGNLCIYTKNDAFVWCAMSHGQQPGCYLILQPDGHLCVYNSNDHFVWGSNTYLLENKPTSLYLSNDGKMVLQDKTNNSVWTSH